MAKGKTLIKYVDQDHHINKMCLYNTDAPWMVTSRSKVMVARSTVLEMVERSFHKENMKALPLTVKSYDQG